MELGISIFNGISIKDQVKYFKRLGINRTFVGSENPDFENTMRLFKDNGIICETLHAPFNKINDMWGEDEVAARDMINRLKDSVDKCEKHNIPVSVVHLSSGRPMPEINDSGVRRFEEIFDYADKKGITIALENQRYKENILFFMEKYNTLGFCWDNGHEYGFSKGIRFMELFGDRLCALHIHDNRCGTDTDDHLLPFDGNIDFEEIAKTIAKRDYKGTVMLEVGKLASIDGKKIYESLSDEDYVKRAADSVRKLANMIENCKKAQGDSFILPF